MNGYQGDGFLSVDAGKGGIKLAMAAWYLGLVALISSIVRTDSIIIYIVRTC